MKNYLSSFLILSIFMFTTHSQALITECGSLAEDGSALSSKTSNQVQFKIGGTDEYIKQWMGENVDTAKQRERIDDCAPGLTKCITQFSDSNKEGQLLLKITLRDDGSRALVSRIDIKTKDFQNEKFITCVKNYWNKVSFPPLRDPGFQKGLVQVSLQAKKMNSK